MSLADPYPLICLIRQGLGSVCIAAPRITLTIQDIYLKDVAGDSQSKRKTIDCLECHIGTGTFKAILNCLVTKAFQYHKMLVMTDVSQITCLSSLAILFPIYVLEKGNASLISHAGD